MEDPEIDVPGNTIEDLLAALLGSRILLGPLRALKMAHLDNIIMCPYVSLQNYVSLQTSWCNKAVETLLTSVDSSEAPRKPKKFALGALKHLGKAPSAEDIDQIRREMLGNSPRQSDHV